ncbi:hypothetical protein DVH24_029184 [Malus domestica]|uniref:KIB1-4 beta-propeller domain-containing protein n=1 Tax=Malus domestica TaxID=3750 RepID=A0A498HZW7_MALDO|nr:hypothetical protein DVH24_029184 [Malus domestica]
MMTHDFLVYKVDLEDGGSFIEVQSLGNQILFVTSQGCSFSLSVSNFTGLEANYIYFAELGVSSYIAVRSKTSMCDFSHHFYLDGQKFGQSREYYYHASPKLMRGLIRVVEAKSKAVHRSCKGWLVMVNGKNLSSIFTKPYFRSQTQTFFLSKYPTVRKILRSKSRWLYKRIVLFSSNIAECTVAAIFLL